MHTSVIRQSDRLHCMILTIEHSGKAKVQGLEKVQWLLMVRAKEGGIGRESTDELQAVKLLCMTYNDRYMSSQMCPNPGGVHQQEQTLT